MDKERREVLEEPQFAVGVRTLLGLGTLYSARRSAAAITRGHRGGSGREDRQQPGDRYLMYMLVPDRLEFSGRRRRFAVDRLALTSLDSLPIALTALVNLVSVTSRTSAFSHPACSGGMDARAAGWRTRW